MTTAIEYALMAGASYVSTRPEINRFPVPAGWLEMIDERRTRPSGFEATYFTNGTEIVISFAGTKDALDIGDNQANVGLATGLGSVQLQQAAEYYLQVKASAPANATITLTGHSLGGGLAALVGVFFGVEAHTFDQAPFANSAESNLLTPDVAANLRADLAAQVDVNGNRLYDDATLSGLDTFLALRQANGGIPNSSLVTNINVQGEFLSGVPWNIPDRIGATVLDIANSANGVAGGDLHAQALLTAFLQSNQTATLNKGLSDVTFKLPDLLKMIFDKNLFAYKADDPDNRNLIDHLVRHEFGNAPGVTAPDAMVTRFTADLWKLAQDGGLTMSENFSYSNWNNVSKTLIAFAMQMYYEDTANAIDPSKQLFTDLSAAGAGSNGIRFDMHDVSKDIAAAMDSTDPNVKVDLAAKQDGKYILKGYEYFLNYFDNTSLLSPAERTLIKSMLPQLRDWYVQAGTGGMVATDTLNRGAFMLGGTGADTLTGGTATDLLVGNAGADTLQGGGGNDMLLGGSGNDTYVYTNGGGLDTILDSDGQGSIVVDGATLAGGGQYGDNRVHKDANGHLYVQAGGNLIIDGGILIKDYNPNFGNGMGLALGDAVQQNTQPNITGDLAPIDTDPSATGVQTQTDALGNVIVDPATSQPGRGDWLYGSAGADVIEGKGGSDILDGKNGDDRLYAGTQISAATAIAQGNAQAGNGATGDWLNGGAGGICMRQRTRAAIINSSKAANDETAHVWRVAA